MQEYRKYKRDMKIKFPNWISARKPSFIQIFTLSHFKYQCKAYFPIMSNVGFLRFFGQH
jgi:hypothetical protein